MFCFLLQERQGSVGMRRNSVRFRETKAEKCPVPVKFPELWYDRQGLGAVRVPHGVVYNGELFK